MLAYGSGVDRTLLCLGLWGMGVSGWSGWGVGTVLLWYRFGRDGGLGRFGVGPYFARADSVDAVGDRSSIGVEWRNDFPA